MLTVDNIRDEFKQLLDSGRYNSRGMLELQGVSFIADKPAIFGTVNEDYIKKELNWYYSESRNVYDMDNPPKIWRNIATPDGYINSNYGYLVFGKDNNNQYQKVLRTLRRRPDSKQATMIYTRPSIHQEAFEGGRRDFICTNTVNYNQDTYNSNKINAIVQMRSNDAVYGYKNDYAWQKHILDKLCTELHKEPGYIVWQVASLHIYEHHFRLITDKIQKGLF